MNPYRLREMDFVMLVRYDEPPLLLVFDQNDVKPSPLAGTLGLRLAYRSTVDLIEFVDLTVRDQKYLWQGMSYQVHRARERYMQLLTLAPPSNNARCLSSIVSCCSSSNNSM